MEEAGPRIYASERKKEKAKQKKKKKALALALALALERKRSTMQWSWPPPTLQQEKLKSLYFRVEMREDWGKVESPPIYHWYAAAADDSKDPSATHVTLPCPVLPRMPLDVLDKSTAVAVGSRIYVVGGTFLPSDISVDKVVFSDTASADKGWKEGPSMIFQRGSPPPSAVAVDGKIYVFGGIKDYIHDNRHLFAEVYDPLQDKWELLPESPFKELTYACPVHAILLDGSGSKNLVVHDPGPGKLYAYNLDAKSWTLFDASFGVTCDRAAAVDGVLYCYDEKSRVYGYDLVKRRWFPYPVEGLDMQGVLPRPFAICTVSLLHIGGGGKLCLVWSCSKAFRYSQVVINCTVFTVRHEEDDVDAEGSRLVADIESTTLYHVDADHFIDCVAL